MSQDDSIVPSGPAEQHDIRLASDLRYVLSADDIESRRPPQNTADDIVIEVLVG
jgi:hypothetical protein